jgi:hypothetical protein
MQAQLVWVSIYLDDDNIYYINRLHRWAQVQDAILQAFLRELLDSDMTIIWHNIKYDLQIITRFLQNSDTQNQVKSGEQIGLDI